MTLLAADAIGLCSGMVCILNVAIVATDTTGQRFHGAMARSAINQVIRVSACRRMVRGPNATLMTIQTISKIANVGVTFHTVARRGCGCVVVTVLLRYEGMAGGTITVGGYALMALVAEPLRIKL